MAATYDAFKVKGKSRNGEHYESEIKFTPGEARAVARRKGGEYEIISRIAKGNGNAGMWSGGETGNFA